MSDEETEVDDEVVGEDDAVGGDDGTPPSDEGETAPVKEGHVRLRGSAAPEVRSSSIFRRLYYGETDYDFVGRAKIWFAISGTIILIGLLGLVGRGGLNLGLEFTGGSQWEVPAGEATVAEVEDVMADLGVSDVKVQEVGELIRVQTSAVEGSDEERRVRNDEVVERLTTVTGSDAADVVLSDVGASWGEEISRKALRALGIFLVAIVIYITLRFEFRMAIATLGALVHDILVVLGVYAVLQLPVTPATVVAILTILGFSIYDGIVVFDRVDENTRLVTSGARMTYSDMVNRSLNEVLMRSLNTQITAILPILSVLIIGSLALGQSTLQEFGLALFIGQLSGAYSSIFIASPLLAILKEREPRYRALRQRVESREAGATADDPDASDGDEKAGKGRVAAGSRRSAPTRRTSAPAAPVRTHPPRPRKQGKRR